MGVVRVVVVVLVVMDGAAAGRAPRVHHGAAAGRQAGSHGWSW
jgi:hypothetical protein